VNRSVEIGAKAVVLVSGGLDSTVALALAGRTHRLSLGLHFDYGQRASAREFEAAKTIARHYEIDLERIELPWLGRISRSALIEGKADVPDADRCGPGGMSLARAVWIENRNGIFVNIAASFAASRGCSVVIAGFNAEEAASFPDNSRHFIDALNDALMDGTSNGVRVMSPTIDMTKPDMIREGLRLGIPWHAIWSCYRGGDAMCGTCESCSRLRRAAEGTAALERLRFGKE
jgi:7-cyano-7-deazaguanine synthase